MTSVQLAEVKKGRAIEKERSVIRGVEATRVGLDR